jgi:hypothetical protein
MRTRTTFQKQKRKEKVLEPIVEFNEHVDFHSSKSSGDVNSLIALLGVPQKKGGKQVLECSIMDEYLEKHEEEASKVEKSSKEFLAFVDAFCVFMVQQVEAMAQNQKIAKLMNFIAKGLGVINSAPSEGFTKATIKARLLASFVRKETKVKAYMETQHLKIDKEQIHFTQTLLKEHVWEWWMSQKQKTLDLFETLTREEFKLWLDGGSRRTTWCIRMGWSFWSSPKETTKAH